MTKQEISEAFSNGNFESTYPFLAENITWMVVGENLFNGKKAVIENCEQTAAYFKSVQTNFKTNHLLQDNNKIAISGTVEFFKNGKSVAFVSAFDLYEFNSEGKLFTITSYCIQHGKQ
jgi:hypothetical protein